MRISDWSSDVCSSDLDAAKVADVLPFDSNAASYLADRARNLDWRLRRFAKQLKTNKLEGVSLERDRLKLQQMPPVTPPEAEALYRKLETLTSEGQRAGNTVDSTCRCR